jgi:long-chain acyl-CoA synthetase
MTAEDVLIVLPLFTLRLNGALVIGQDRCHRDYLSSRPDALSMVAKYSATVVTTAPPVYTAWLAQPGLDARLSRVRLLISGAAPLSGRIFSELLELGGLPVWEGYGMTEASPVITSTLVSGRAKPGSVGVPLPGIDLKICDEAGNEVDDGDPGEVVIRGDNLLSGIGRPRRRSRRRRLVADLGCCDPRPRG